MKEKKTAKKQKKKEKEKRTTKGWPDSTFMKMRLDENGKKRL